MKTNLDETTARLILDAGARAERAGKDAQLEAYRLEVECLTELARKDSNFKASQRVIHASLQAEIMIVRGELARLEGVEKERVAQVEGVVSELEQVKARLVEAQAIAGRLKDENDDLKRKASARDTRKDSA